MIPLFKVFMPDGVVPPLTETLYSGYIGQGPRVDEFEGKLSPWLGRANVLTLNSGTSALHLALRLSNVGSGDEVISTAMTCTATNEPMMERGARIVWADINPMTGNIDPDSIRKRITPRTKAIMAVHWGGYPCDMDEIGEIARDRSVKVIEDAAHAFGAQYHGAPIGSHSDFVCFSFQAIKHLTTVDGGALTTRTREDYERGKLLRWYGIDRTTPRKDFRCEEDIREFGYKFHMNDVNATIGLVQLQHVEKVLARHRENAAFYRKELADVPGVTLLENRRDRDSASWLFTMHVENRSEFMKHMSDRGVATSQVHARNDTHAMFREFKRPLPGVDRFTATQVSIPVGWWVTDADRQIVVDAVREFAKKAVKAVN